MGMVLSYSYLVLDEVLYALFYIQTWMKTQTFYGKHIFMELKHIFFTNTTRDSRPMCNPLLANDGQWKFHLMKFIII